ADRRVLKESQPSEDDLHVAALELIRSVGSADAALAGHLGAPCHIARRRSLDQVPAIEDPVRLSALAVAQVARADDCPSWGCRSWVHVSSLPHPQGLLAHLADPGAVADGAVAAMAPRTARASALGSLTRHRAGARHRGRAGGLDLAGLAHLIPAGAVEKEVVVRGAPLPPHGDLHYLLARLDPRGAAPTIAVPIGGGGHDLRLAVPAIGGAEVTRHARRAGLVRRADALRPADLGAGGDGL